MPDSIRMMDLAALTRSIDEFRHLDPEHRALARRLAAQATAHRVDEARQDVPENERAAETQIRDRQGRGRQRRNGRPQSPDSAAEGDEEPALERNEGRLLDFLA